MAQRTRFQIYQPKTILNKAKRADHWFWTRYSAYPYIGCQHGCAFCYCRERKYIPYKPQETDEVYDEEEDKFSHLIKVKENAPHLLRRALMRVPVDMVFTGDYQPAERKYKISRQMLEVCAELGFPVFVLTRSALVLRDMDVLQSINQRSRAVVAFSIISTPESAGYIRISKLEGLAPTVERRFAAMEQLASDGILTGTVAMPLLPGLCNDDQNLHALTHWTVSHGGKFVLAGGLTLADQQKAFFLRALGKDCPDLLPTYQRLYPPGSYAQAQPWQNVGLRIGEFCHQAGISDRIPRPIIPGEKRALNKRIVERLANQCYWMELEKAPSQRIWAYRKAAWAVEDLEQDIDLVYKNMGRRGLEGIENIGIQMGEVVERLHNELSDNPGI